MGKVVDTDLRVKVSLDLQTSNWKAWLGTNCQ